MQLRRLIAFTAALAVVPATGAMAGPGIYTKVLQAYQASGSVPPCQFTSAQLQAALKGVDTYGEQYFADFTNAVQAALAARASGACAPRGTPSQSTAPAGVNSRFVPPPVTAATASGLPAPILVLAGLSVVLLFLGALTAVGRARGWDPRWLASVRHGAGEAGYRAANAWERLVARGR